ncbi:MAG TPA: UDP-N-acetylmuramyl-tripeptide synthetase [Lactobacillaceae bacterium]|jgi:UDP-N-acetylmuramoyl-L-alanyl-D-glutamate--2,6-diaminopimelate ligase
MLKVTDIENSLRAHDLLVRAPQTAVTAFDFLHYDTRRVENNTLFVVKGNFKAEYLANVVGVTGVVTETPLAVDVPQWVVRDSQKALSVLAQLFFDYPQKALWIAGITGTKGKTTGAYFVYEMLKRATNNRTALFSTVDRVTGPRPADKKKSDLTTPESYELFKDMRRAVDNGMTHLVMEVSSQAYLKQRVYGLDFQVGVFLNISPDHIGPSEHPDFEDYLRHKLMLFDHSEKVVINADADQFDVILAHARLTHADDAIFVYGLNAPFSYASLGGDVLASEFVVRGETTRIDVNGTYRLNVPGDFNESNALASLIVAGLAGANLASRQAGLAQVAIPGRMLTVDLGKHGVAFVDYAHNYASMQALLSFAQKQYPAGRVLVVVGAPGNKAESRRADFGRVLSELADVVYLTADDPQFEQPRTIADEIAAHITNDALSVHFEMDRLAAIEQAILAAGEQDIVVVAGKGEDPYQKIDGVDTHYIGDFAAVKNVAERLKKA